MLKSSFSSSVFVFPLIFYVLLSISTKLARDTFALLVAAASDASLKISNIFRSKIFRHRPRRQHPAGVDAFVCGGI